ncbi:hypothetical protein JMJ35_006986 [Cladonia borealis]|uniref:Heterokaryon incompatibility domain-containing protein n=1 Tax=Cladonia borealis TaxID=184061 RepID=A0AA39V3Z1_9LECA|nr:hypothetical protein JMJ35_006986 [Cladonia borealis]
MAPYEYSALDESASEIRLMTLLPGRFKDDIFITMETVVLTKEHVPQYEALSYVWGSTEYPTVISVEAREPKRSKSFSLFGRSRRRRLEACSHGTISVTQNLAIALPHLRKEDKPRVFWIDAICVNQRDRAERGHQVKRMAAVYSIASQVIVWLGPESQNSTSALRALDGLGSQLRVDWSTLNMTSVSTGEIITQLDDPFDDETWKSVWDLLRRPWFERLWIWQEVRLAREAYLFCGNEGVPWESLRRAILYLRRASKPEGFSHLIRCCYNLVSYGDYVAGAFDSLDIILEDTKFASCSDPRDKIFAVLSLAHKDKTRGLDPDYSKPAEAVYQNLVLHYISNINSLEILAHCNLRDDTGGMKLPTWVPDWTVPRLSETIRFSATYLNSEPRVRYQDGRVLAATGVHVAVIECLQTLPQPAGPEDYLYYDEIEDAIRALILPKIESLSLSERDATVNSLCRTLCCNLFADGFSPPTSNLASFELCRKYIHRIVDTTRDTVPENSPEEDLYLSEIRSTIRGRFLFTTVDGYIGLAPIATKPGDEVCILLGCQTPLVLRPCGDGYHKVVGDCYIDGFMEGAACLGPLPSKWQLVSRYFEEFSGYYINFLDHQTGKFQIEDPRLGLLPAGWYICDHEEKDAWSLYANDETGEETFFDPRMSPEALTARGVEMREFQLV